MDQTLSRRVTLLLAFLCHEKSDIELDKDCEITHITYKGGKDFQYWNTLKSSLTV